jgi:filamentous hemagglutinin family protein
MTLHSHSFVPRLVALLVAASCGPLQAAPAAPQVVSGQASFAQQGNVFSITNTPNAIINWQSFSINAGEVTRFIQQSSDSAVLNRIVGQDPSRILGALQSNGHVFLINPNGILFGRDARIDVHGLTASTLALSNADFLAGKNNFQGGAGAGRLDNQGSITTPVGGKVFLLAPDVSNSGIITSPQGQVVLAAGHTVQLVDSANPDLHVVVAAPSDQAVNLGQIIAQGGKVGIYGALVRQRGVLNADSAQVGANGKIVLRASADAMLEAGSVTSATGAGKGGQVSVEGERVGMTGDARIDVSGAAGGGTVLLGGGYQGKNALVKNARQTLLGPKASIRADATSAGNGGTVVLWGDASTRAQGRISARGGPLSGHGGLVETSGHYLDVNGIVVDAGAARGASGTWLLDPFDIEVVASGGLATLADVDQFADAGSFVTINANTLSSVVSGTNIVLQATNNVKFSAPINPLLGPGSLQVDAGNNIYIDAAINTGGGALRLNANHPAFASTTGEIIMGSGGAINTFGGAVNMDGTQVSLFGPLSTQGGNVMINGGNLAHFGSNITTANGILHVTANDIMLGGAGTLADSGTGAMIFTATGGAFSLGSGYTLASSNNIAVGADVMTLDGMMGPSAGVRPMINFRTFTPTKDIDFSVDLGSGALELDPTWLATLDVAWLQIGGPSQLGNIHVYQEYVGGLANKLTLNTSGNILVSKPLSMPAGTGSALELILGGTNSAGNIATSPDSINPGGRLAADNVVLRANTMSLGASVTGSNAGHVTMMPHMASGQVQIGGGAADGANMLGLDNSELGLISARTLAIGDDLLQSNTLTVLPSGMDFSAFMNASSKLHLRGGQGDVNVQGNLTTAGGLLLQGSHIGTAPGARVKALGIILNAVQGIGSDPDPLTTEATFMAAANTMPGGVAPIHIANTGPLQLGRIQQIGAGNQGAITVSNIGAMTVPEFEPSSVTPVSISTGGAGKILLKTMSPLTINGDIISDTGTITLEAGGGGLLTIGPSGSVTSNAGSIALTAGDVLNNGSVSTLTGDINVTAADSASGSGTYNAPGGSINGLTPTVPQCLSNPALSGCTAILKAALDACIVNPLGPFCSALLPSLASCISDPSIYGCVAVLPKLADCILDPSKPGCSVVLPSLAACIADPSKPGCSVVLPSLAACIADPSKPGCSVVLPSLSACIANPSVLGCAVVLPSLAVCIANPSTPGCVVVLPSLSACIADPSKHGCVAVLPSLSTCIANPSAQGCSVVLPSLSACIEAPRTAGCVVVLPALTQCIANPSLPGCAVVLAERDNCEINPHAAACQVAAPEVPLEVVNAVLVTLVNAPGGDGAPDKLADEKKTDDKKADGEKDGNDEKIGVKDEVRKKTYCN